MFSQIPDNLSNEVASVARQINLPFDAAVCEALQHWVDRVRPRRLPDSPIVDDMQTLEGVLPKSISATHCRSSGKAKIA